MSLSSPTRKKNCTFCTIIDSKVEQHLKSDNNLVVIADVKPHAKYHYLVLTKEHIDSVGDLQPEQSTLVRRMEVFGREVLRERLKAAGEPDIIEDLLRCGFHYGPLVSIHHMHMHIIYPTDHMSMLSRFVLFRPSRYFRLTDDVASALEEQLPKQEQEASPTQTSI